MAYGDEQDNEAERERLEQDELQRQLSGKPTAGNPADYSRFTEGMTQRGDDSRGVGGSAMSGAGLGATAGSVLPGLGTAMGAGVGALGGAIYGAFNKHADTAKTDYSVEDARKAIGSAYKEFNGRDVEESELDTMIRGQGWKPGDRFVGSGGLNSVIGSLKSNADKVRAAAPAAQVPEAASASAAPAAVPAKPGQGAYPGSGWDEGKWNDPNSTSAKYIVGRHMASIRDKMLAIPDEAGRKAFVQAELETLRPALQAAGWQVGDIKGEKLQLAGGKSGDPQHWADAIGDIEGAGTVSWTTDLPDAGGGAPAGSMPGGGDGASPGLVPTDTNFYNQLQAKLAEILGGPEAFDREALLAQLTGK